MNLVSSSVHGVTVPLVTPFDQSGFEIDRARLGFHADRVVSQGASCLLAADLVGQSWALPQSEKMTVVRTAAEAAGGRAPVIAKLSEAGLTDQVSVARAFRAAGADAIKVAAPMSTRAADDAQLLRWLTAAGEAATMPFSVEGYADVPVRVLEELCRHELFLGYEEASRDVAASQDLVSRFVSDTTVIAGSEDVLPYTLLAGAQGLMTATPNSAMEFMLDLFATARSGDPAKTFAQFKKLRAYRLLFDSDLKRGVYAFVTYTKESLAALGHPVGPPRPPLAPLSAVRRRAAPVLPGAGPAQMRRELTSSYANPGSWSGSSRSRCGVKPGENPGVLTLTETRFESARTTQPAPFLPYRNSASRSGR